MKPEGNGRSLFSFPAPIGYPGNEKMSTRGRKGIPFSSMMYVSRKSPPSPLPSATFFHLHSEREV
jgi:hypothetical protein